MPKPSPTPDEPARVHYDCGKCPAFCCAVYERVKVTKRDLNRLARHFNLSSVAAERRFTKLRDGERVLRRTPDEVLGEACQFLDRETRRCTIYEARPAVCRVYPARSRCAYFDLLQFERRQQGDETVVPRVQIVFHEWRPPSPAAAGANGTARPRRTGKNGAPRRREPVIVTPPILAPVGELGLGPPAAEEAGNPGTAE